MTVQEVIENLKYLISDDCTETQKDYVEEIEFAIKALEKQEPKVPITIRKSKDLIVFECPNCGRESIPRNKPCCWWCGQALDWSST